MTNAEHHTMQQNKTFMESKIGEMPHHYFGPSSYDETMTGTDKSSAVASPLLAMPRRSVGSSELRLKKDLQVDSGETSILQSHQSEKRLKKRASSSIDD